MNRSEQILLGIKDAKTLYERQLDPLLERNGLSKLQIDVLLFLYNNPEHDTAQSVCSLRGLAKSNVSKGVDGLVQLGLLERRTDPDNRRTVHLKLTDKALPAVQEGAACQYRFFRLLLQGISSDEMETVLRLFSQIHDNVRKGLGGL